jgi:hypothetical protein
VLAGVVAGTVQQVAFEQAPPLGHTMPHPLQLFGSDETSVQTPAQNTLGEAQVHDPLQVSAPVHALPQLPQLLVSLVRSAHVSEVEQYVCPVGQLHAPPLHVSPSLHTLPHDPQLLLSLEVSAQVDSSAQYVWPAGQPHLPLVHVWPFGQTFPHVPQSPALVWVLTQDPVQHVSRTPQTLPQ